MRGPTRSERIKEHRKERINRAITAIEGRNVVRNKMSKGNKIVLFVIIAVFFIVNFSTIRFRGATFNFSFDDFKVHYEDFVLYNENKFAYDKKIKEIIKNDNEYSILQYSSMDTSNLIAIYQYTDKVKKVGVIGRPKDSDIFPKSYLENMILLVSLVTDKDYNESLEYLKKLEFLDENYNIIKREKIFRTRNNGLSMSILHRDDSVIFTIGK